MCFIVVLKVLLSCAVDISWSYEVHFAFVHSQIVDQAFAVAPENFLSVIYNDDVEVTLGNELKVTEVQGEPKLRWPYKDDKYYTMLMADADAPTRETPVARSKLLWLVGNIKGNNITSAQTKCARTWPNLLSDNHRIYFLVYEHDNEFYENFGNDSEERENFSPDKFSDRNDLGFPYAGNFFIAKII